MLEPLIVAAQIYDVAHTQNHLSRFPNSRETDWWTAAFAGRDRRNIVVQQLDTTVQAVRATQ